MRRLPDSPTPRIEHTACRFDLAQRVAQAHVVIGDEALLALVSGSVVDAQADALSDVDMSVVLHTMPERSVLQAAGARSGGAPWNWTWGSDEEGLVVQFELSGVQIQIAYTTHARLQGELDELLVAHNPDTPLHKLAEGMLKAKALVNVPALAAIQARLAAFPPALGRAMVEHGLKSVTPWRAVNQLVYRDTPVWCRELQVEACYALLLVLCGLNGRYFTRFQVKRVGGLAAKLVHAPSALAARMDALLCAPPADAFAQLHVLEGEVLALVAQHLPDVDIGPVQARRAAFKPG
jgi:hypothetical protein